MVQVTWGTFLLHFNAQFELQQAVLPMSTYLNALRFSHVIRWLDSYVTEQFQKYLLKCSVTTYKSKPHLMLQRLTEKRQHRLELRTSMLKDCSQPGVIKYTPTTHTLDNLSVKGSD